MTYPYLTQSQMEEMPTKRLLAYYRGLLKVHETPHWDAPKEDVGGTKKDPEWEKARVATKEILGRREHVSSKPRKNANPDKPSRPLCQCGHSHASHSWHGSFCYKCEYGKCEKYQATIDAKVS
jgi:hypothetical protein